MVMGDGWVWWGGVDSGQGQAWVEPRDQFGLWISVEGPDEEVFVEKQPNFRPPKLRLDPKFPTQKIWWLRAVEILPGLREGDADVVGLPAAEGIESKHG